MPQPDWSVITGDCLDVLPTFGDCSFDAIATDPPYGLEFMGKEWDSFGSNGFRRCRNAADAERDSVFGRTSKSGPEYIAGTAYQQWCQQWAAECLRVLKPGGHLAAFGGTRTYHRLACAIEDAGFEIRDSLHWIYGSGFPKSHDVSKAVDKAAGAEREIVGRRTDRAATPKQDITSGRLIGGVNGAYDGSAITAPATPDAQKWQGWGTALKPAHEPVVLARKPFKGTVAGNVVEFGTGAVNVDGCRVGSEGRPARKQLPASDSQSKFNQNAGLSGMAAGTTNKGRWPPNVLLTHSQDCIPADDGEHCIDCCIDGCPVAEMDRQSGNRLGFSTQRHLSPEKPGIFGVGHGSNTMPYHTGYDDQGGASRFFPIFRYQPKASRKERPAAGGITAHPTVKPLELMRWLVRLITPPGGMVLDPFGGTGTTAQACQLEGFTCTLIERDPDYVRLTRERMTEYQEGA